MKTKLVATFLLSLTAAAVLIYPELGNTTRQALPPVAGQPLPPQQDQRPRIEVVFVLDTTGSMGGLIQTAKEKIWSIASTMASAQSAPEIHVGLVAYRDRGDAYVTRVTDLSTDLDSMYATLMDFQADGGGDGPESVNAALAASLDQISWSDDPDTYRVVFLVGDAPPHMDYAEEQYPQIMARAAGRGIVVNTIRCGNNAVTEAQWRQIASLTQGDYFTVEQAGSAVAIATPFDAELASLSADLDATRLAYGDREAQERALLKSVATEKLHAGASVASRARRAAFNVSDGGRANQFGDSDLVEAVSAGRVDLADLPEEALPAAIAPLSAEQRNDYVQRQVAVRQELEQQLREVAAKRDEYLAAQAETTEAIEDSLDYQMFEAVRSQAAKKGIDYEADAAPKL